MDPRSPLMLAVAALCVPALALAQPRASERATVTQIVNGTTITVDFSRPVARGRENLFGGVVHYGEMWTPGANWATTLEVDKPIHLNGHAVPPGKYSVWMQPSNADWAVFLNTEWRLYHDTPVSEDRVLLRFEVAPERGAHMEALNWYVHSIRPRAATLRMHWGSTYVSLEIETAEFVWDPLPAGERASYLGAFSFDTEDPTTGGPLRVTITVMELNGRIVGRWGRAPVALVPLGDGEFQIGFLRNAELFDVGDELTLRVLVEDGESVGAQLLWEGRPFADGSKAR